MRVCAALFLKLYRDVKAGTHLIAMCVKSN